MMLVAVAVRPGALVRWHDEMMIFLEKVNQIG